MSNFFKHIDIPQRTNTNRLYHSQISSIQEKATKTYSKLQKALPVFKILIAYSQIVSNFSFVFDMEFPPMFTSLMSIMEPISNLDFVNFVPLDCIFRSNFDQKMLAQVYLPVIIGFLMLTAYSQLKKRGTSEEEKVRLMPHNFTLFFFSLTQQKYNRRHHQSTDSELPSATGSLEHFSLAPLQSCHLPP